MEPLMAFIEVDGVTRCVCLRCTIDMFQLGMLRVKEERPMKVVGGEPGAFAAVIYEIVPPYTLLECRMTADAGGHIGPPWGQ